MRCGCLQSCSCIINGGDCITVTGNGGSGTPYVVNFTPDNCEGLVSGDDGNQLVSGTDGGLYVDPAAGISSGYDTIGGFIHGPDVGTASGMGLYFGDAGLTFDMTVTMDRPGSIVGVKAAAVSPRTGGSMLFEVYKNDVATGLTCVLDGTNPRNAYGTQAVGLDTFVAGDYLDIRMTTSSYTGPQLFGAQITVIYD